MSSIRIANAAGFLGDDTGVPATMLEEEPLDFLTLEYLAELTMAILARLREKDPRQGFARDFLGVLKSLIPAWQGQPRCRIATNAGGVNPWGCAREAGKILTEANQGDAIVAAVAGDDLLGRLDSLRQSGVAFEHFDTGEPLWNLLESGDIEPSSIVAANAYLGAGGICEAFDRGAQIVIAGRIADASLAVGPAWHALGWPRNDLPRLAAATVAGHLIECGAQATGGYSTRWQRGELSRVGYPIAELDSDGGLVITKPRNSSGRVDRLAVAEQLIYEIGDPAHYLTPDLDLDLTAIELAEEGPNRVRVAGARGTPPPETYKVSIVYRDGFAAAGQLLVCGGDCRSKARESARIILERLDRQGLLPQRTCLELLGAGDGWPLTTTSRTISGEALLARLQKSEEPQASHQREIVMRLAVHDRRRGAVEAFSRSIAPLITSGPAGLAGYAAGRPEIRPAFSYWPARIPRDLVFPTVDLRSAASWAAASPGE